MLHLSDLRITLILVWTGPGCFGTCRCHLRLLVRQILVTVISDGAQQDGELNRCIGLCYCVFLLRILQKAPTLRLKAKPGVKSVPSCDTEGKLFVFVPHR